MARRSREQTRTLLLETGALLALERFRDALDAEAVAGPTSTISSAQVCAAAGVTTGSLYQLWDNQDAYRRDLLFHLLESANSDPVDTSEIVGKGAAATDNPDDAVRIIGQLAWERLRDRDTYGIFLSAFGLIRDPEVAAAIAMVYRKADDANIPLYELLLAFFGLRMRPPLEVADLAVAIGALNDGFTIRWKVDPAATRPDLVWQPDDPDAEWSLFTVSAAGLVRALTEPDEHTRDQPSDLLAG
jgi:AcrR family transcriptional regulator